MMALVSSHFGQIPSVSNELPVDLAAFIVPRTGPPRVVVQHSTPSAQLSAVTITFVRPRPPSQWNTITAMQEQLLECLLSRVLADRLTHIKQQGLGLVDFAIDTQEVPCYRAYCIELACRPGCVEAAVRNTWAQLRLLRDVGLLSAELGYVITHLDMSIRSGLLDQVETPSSTLVESLRQHCMNITVHASQTTELQLWDDLKAKLTPALLQAKTAQLLPSASCCISVFDSSMSNDTLTASLNATLAELEGANKHVLAMKYTIKTVVASDAPPLFARPPPPDKTVLASIEDNIECDFGSDKKSVRLMLPCGMVVTLVSESAVRNQGLELQCSLFGTGLGLAELFLAYQPECFLAAQLAPIIACSLGVAGVESPLVLNQWCRSNLVEIESLKVTMTGLSYASYLFILFNMLFDYYIFKNLHIIYICMIL